MLDLMNSAPVWRDAQQLATLTIVASYQNDKFGGWAWPSHAKIAEKLRLSERQTLRIIQDLTDCGLLEVQVRSAGRNNSRNQYRVRLDRRTCDTGVTSDARAALSHDTGADACDIGDRHPDAGDTSAGDIGDRSLVTSGAVARALDSVESTTCDFEQVIVQREVIEPEQNAKRELAAAALPNASPPTPNPSNTNGHLSAAFVKARDSAVLLVGRANSIEQLIDHVTAEIGVFGSVDTEAVAAACRFVWLKANMVGMNTLMRTSA